MNTAEQLLARRFHGTDSVMALYLRVADRCNHACVHCYEVQGLQGELDTKSVLEIIDRAVDNGLFFLSISGGEATLRADLLDIIAHARARHLVVSLYTNAFSMTPELAQRLADLGVWHVQVSLYGATPDVHEGVTKVPGSHARTVRGIGLLREAGLTVNIAYSVMASNVRDRDAMKQLAERLGCGLRVSETIAPREDGTSLRELRASSEDRQEQLRDAKFDFSPAAIERGRQNATCQVGKSSFAVDPNGEVLPCSMLAVPLGNALEQPMRDIVAGETARFIGSLDVQALHGCRDCDLIAGCHRCHAAALREAGDALGPYASACEVAVARYRASIDAEVEIVPLEVGRGRAANLGPYRIEMPSRLRQIPDRITEQDELAVEKFPWIRPGGGDVRDASLVPLRVRKRLSVS